MEGLSAPHALCCLHTVACTSSGWEPNTGLSALAMPGSSSKCNAWALPSGMSNWLRGLGSAEFKNVLKVLRTTDLRCYHRG